MNNNVVRKTTRFCLVVFICVFGLFGNNVLAATRTIASGEGNLEAMNLAITHGEEATKAASEGQVDAALENIKIAVKATGKIEVANGAALEKAVTRLKIARRDIKKGKPVEDSVKALEEAVALLKELKAEF